MSLNAEFVQANFKTGDPRNTFGDFYFKVVPKGFCEVPGVLLGFPSLGVSPHGVGWSVRSASHYFSKYKVHLPRAELAKRTEHRECLKDWYQDVPVDASEQIKLLMEDSTAMSTEVLATFDGHDTLVFGPI